MPFWLNINLQNSNSPMMEFLVFFHDILMILIMMIIINLLILFVYMYTMKIFCLNFPESTSLEDFWLSVPIVFLLFIGFPSIKNLYLYEEFNESDLNIKIVGHQWYWSYELMNLNIMFDSFMKKNDFNFRLLETSNHLIIPAKIIIRFLVSSEDVIHSWTIPSLGIKMDAMPGRISQFVTLINRPSILIGQCSEICGINHSFMPITLTATKMNNFFS